MTVTQNLNTLKIHTFSDQEKYNKAINAGAIVDDSALYLAPAEEIKAFGKLNINGMLIEATKESDTIILTADSFIKISVSGKTLSYSAVKGDTDTLGVVKLADSISEDATTAITPAGVRNALGALTCTVQESAEPSTEFIDTITQINGVISATKKAIPYANENTSGIVKLSNDSNSIANNVAITPGSLYKKSADANHQVYYNTLRDIMSTFDPNNTYQDNIIIIPEGTTTVTSSLITLSQKSSAKVVAIPTSVTEIGTSAFFLCASLTSVIIPDSVTIIGDAAFYSCENLTSVIIGDSVESINNQAFAYCDGLTSIVIPNSVTSIGDEAFDGCSSLTSIVIGDSVTSIGEKAFFQCPYLTNIYYRGTIEQWNKISKGTNWNLLTGEYTITYNYKD